MKKILHSLFKISLFEQLLYFVYQNVKFKLLLKLIPPNTLFEIGTFRSIIRKGIHYNLDISSFNQWAIYWGIPEELIVKDFIYKKLNVGMKVLDLGANIGEVTLNAAKVVGQTGKVFSIEAFLPTYKKLEEHVKQNNFCNITALNLAIGEKNGMISMEIVTTHNMGMNKISKQKETVNEVSMKTIDYLVDIGLIDEDIDLVKIDIEGYEYQAIKGMTKLLQKVKPIIVAEIDDKLMSHFGTNPKMVIEFLSKIGYENFNIVESGQLIDTSFDFRNCHFDMICS